MTDTYGDEFDVAAVFNLVYDHAKMALEQARSVLALRGVIDGRAIGNHHHDAALLRPCHEAAIGPFQRFAVNVLF